MRHDISAAISISQQRRSWRPRARVISVPHMSNRKAKMAPGDFYAAKHLQLIWNEKLAQARDEGRGWTQEQAGEAMNMTQGAVSQYLGAKIPLGYGATLKFAKFLGVPPSDIRSDLDALPRESAEEPYEDVIGYP